MVTLSISSFKTFLKEEQSEDHYRRSSFKILNGEQKEIGLLEISISFIQLRRGLTEPPLEGTIDHDSFLNSKICRPAANPDSMSKSKNSKPLPSSFPKKKAEENKDSFYDPSEEYDSVPVMQRASGSSRPEKPNLQSHLSASMLSNTEDLNKKKQQKSAVEAMMERKNSQTKSRGFFEDSQPDEKQSLQKKDSIKRPMTALKKDAAPASQLAGRGSRVGFDSSVKKPADSQVSKSRDHPEKSLEEKLTELAKMPSIHEMATGAYYPEPLYYHKVDSRDQRKQFTTGQTAFLAQTRHRGSSSSSRAQPRGGLSRSTPKPARTRATRARREKSRSRTSPPQSSRTRSC